MPRHLCGFATADLHVNSEVTKAGPRWNGCIINHRSQGAEMSNFFRYAGIAASVVLIAFGIGAIYTGIDGRNMVRHDLAQEQIVGTDDSTIPGQKVDTGKEAQAFAKVMR